MAYFLQYGNWGTEHLSYPKLSDHEKWMNGNLAALETLNFVGIATLLIKPDSNQIVLIKSQKSNNRQRVGGCDKRRLNPNRIPFIPGKACN